MIVNGHKTKEILIGSVLCRDPPLSATLSGVPVERVTMSQASRPKLRRTSISSSG